MLITVWYSGNRVVWDTFQLPVLVKHRENKLLSLTFLAGIES